MTENKKPFGLKLACKMAHDAILQSVAPVSIVLYNLLSLQKDTVFPKNLDTHFFAISPKFVPEEDKRLVAKILDKMRSPHLDTSSLLEEFVKDEWVTKKLPKEEFKNSKDNVQFKKDTNNMPSKKNSVKKSNVKKVVKQTSTVEKKEPIITVKRSRTI